MSFVYIVVNKLKIPPAVIMGVYVAQYPRVAHAPYRIGHAILWYSALILLDSLTIRNHQGKYTIDHSVYPKVQPRLYEFVITYLFGQSHVSHRMIHYIQTPTPYPFGSIPYPFVQLYILWYILDLSNRIVLSFRIAAPIPSDIRQGNTDSSPILYLSYTPILSPYSVESDFQVGYPLDQRVPQKTPICSIFVLTCSRFVTKPDQIVKRTNIEQTMIFYT